MKNYPRSEDKRQNNFFISIAICKKIKTILVTYISADLSISIPNGGILMHKELG